MADCDLVLDMDVFEILQEILEGDELREKIDRCFSEISAEMKEIAGSDLPGASDTIKRAAHRAAGVASIIGAASLKTVFNQLEDSLSDGNYALASEYVGKSVAEFARTREAIAAEMA